MTFFYAFNLEGSVDFFSNKLLSKLWIFPFSISKNSLLLIEFFLTFLAVLLLM